MRLLKGNVPAIRSAAISSARHVMNVAQRAERAVQNVPRSASVAVLEASDSYSYTCTLS
jgi:hypothetical protein